MYNKVVLVGTIETGVEQASKDQSMGVFTLKTQKTWMHKSKGKSQTENQWHKIVVRGPLLRSCRRIIIKNKIIIVEGELRSSEKNNDEISGTTNRYHYADEVVATFIKRFNI